MIPHDALSERVKKRVAERIRAIETDLGKGGVEDMASYHRQTGTIRGLREAVSILSEVASTLHMEEDDEA